MNKADFVTSLFLIVLAISIILVSFQMPTFVDVGAHPLSAPGIVPSMLGVIIGIFGFILLIRSILHKGFTIKFSIKDIVIFFRNASIQRLIITLFWSILYVILLGKMNYFLLTFLFITFFIMSFEIKFFKKSIDNKKAIINALFIGIFISTVITLVFRYLFLVNLP
ncbi:MAG: tripartite tricarboxylate transporter TctB family protein [Bacteroidales bacterium]|nr:tripartite tricarboxylate transporter TctB family protein [Bacteroidales bacterium]